MGCLPHEIHLLGAKASLVRYVPPTPTYALGSRAGQIKKYADHILGVLEDNGLGRTGLPIQLRVGSPRRILPGKEDRCLTLADVINQPPRERARNLQALLVLTSLLLVAQGVLVDTGQGNGILPTGADISAVYFFDSDRPEQGIAWSELIQILIDYLGRAQGELFVSQKVTIQSDRLAKLNPSLSYGGRRLERVWINWLGFFKTGFVTVSIPEILELDRQKHQFTTREFQLVAQRYLMPQVTLLLGPLRQAYLAWLSVSPRRIYTDRAEEFTNIIDDLNVKIAQSLLNRSAKSFLLTAALRLLNLSTHFPSPTRN